MNSEFEKVYKPRFEESKDGNEIWYWAIEIKVKLWLRSDKDWVLNQVKSIFEIWWIFYLKGSKIRMNIDS